MQPQIQVAYAEDQHVIREGIVRMINSDPRVSVTVEGANGAELLDKLSRCQSLPDVCILDIEMPVMNGFEATLEIKRRWPHMPVMAFTTFENELYLIRMIQNGANGFLSKNCTRDKLLNAIYTLQRTGRYYSDRFSKSFIDAIENGQITIPHLTYREEQVLQLSCSDMSYADMAREMSVSPRSVEGFRDSLFKKLKQKSRAGLIKYAIKFGFLPPDE